MDRVDTSAHNPRERTQPQRDFLPGIDLCGAQLAADWLLPVGLDEHEAVGAILELLAVGDLRSDGLANEAVQIVADRPELLPELVEALSSDDPNVRGHGADALEKLARFQPEAFVQFLPFIKRQAVSDGVPMVRWHLAMLLGHISAIPEATAEAAKTLGALITDPSPFVRSWAIASLVIVAQWSPSTAPAAVRAISAHVSDRSPAVAKRAQTAIRALTDRSFRIPKSWDKSRRR